MPRLLLAHCVFLIAALAVAACGGDDDAHPASATPATAAPTSTPAVAFALISTAFADGGAIPAAFTCDGASTSPPLSWAGIPAGAKGLILIVEDPDAPGGTFDHWTVYAIAAEAGGFPASTSPRPGGLPGQATEGLNGAGKIGYLGPCPPAGQQHRYRFSLLAVDAALALPPGRPKAAVLDATAGHTLATATLTGTYRRP